MILYSEQNSSGGNNNNNCHAITFSSNWWCSWDDSLIWYVSDLDRVCGESCVGKEKKEIIIIIRKSWSLFTVPTYCTYSTHKLFPLFQDVSPETSLVVFYVSLIFLFFFHPFSPYRIIMMIFPLYDTLTTERDWLTTKITLNEYFQNVTKPLRAAPKKKK